MFENGSGLTFFLGVSFLAPLLTIGLVVLGIVAISRNDHDPTGRRPFAFYLYSVCFVALFAIVFSGVGLVSSISSVIGDDESSFTSDSSSDSDSDDSGSFRVDEDGNVIRSGSSSGSAQTSSDAVDDERNDEIIRSAFQAGVVGLIALAIFAFHWKQADGLTREPEFWGSPAWRIRSTYMYLVCFVAMMILLVAGAIAAYSLFRVVLPEIAAAAGQTDDAERDAGARQFLVSGALVAAGFVLASTHWRWLKGLRPVPPAPEVSFQRPLEPGV